MNTIQKLQFELMKRASFNEFDGEAVVRDLESHEDLWHGVVMTRLESLIQLRDIVNDYWNVDTVFIIPRIGKEDELERLVSGWQADEVFWIGGDEAGMLLGALSPRIRSNPKLILRVWWD